MADLATKEGREEARKNLCGPRWDQYSDWVVALRQALDLLDQWDEQLQAHQAQAAQQPSPPTWLDAPDGPGRYLEGHFVWPGHWVDHTITFKDQGEIDKRIKLYGGLTKYYPLPTPPAPPEG